MDNALILLLLLLNGFWLMTVPFVLPGNWLMVLSTVIFAWWHWDAQIFSIYTLITIVLLAFAGEVVEFFAGMGGARRAGAGWRGSIGAILGAFTGSILGTFLIPIPLVGTVAGLCIGAGIGAGFFEGIGGAGVSRSLSFGLAAGLGQFIGTTAKFSLGVLIWIIIAVSAFWG